MIILTPAHRARIRQYIGALDMPSDEVEEQIHIRRLPGTDISAQKAVLDLIKTMEDDDDGA